MARRKNRNKRRQKQQAPAVELEEETSVEISDQLDPVKAPQQWSKAVHVAALLAIGVTQKEAANAAGCSDRTVRNWIHSSWWPNAVEQAKDTMLSSLFMRAYQTIYKDVSENPDRAWQVLERLSLQLAPPADRVHIEQDMRQVQTVEQNIVQTQQVRAKEMPDDLLFQLLELKRKQRTSGESGE